MTNNYELVVIIRQDVSTAQAEQLSKDIETILTENGGTISKQESWGLRSFSYRIRKNRKGHYVYFEVLLGGQAVHEIERRLKLHEDILRHQVVRVEAFVEGPSAVLQSKQRDERGGEGGYGSYDRGNRERGDRDEGYRPRGRSNDDADAA